jgi:NADPH:quinone reductase-like Zn-dependent oxidoreductase
MKSMRAIRIHKTGGREVMQLEQIPLPSAQQLGPRHVLVKNKAIGVNFIDTYFREGLYKANLPLTLGKEAAGEVLAVGSEIKDIRQGDRIVYSAVSGAYAEETLVDNEMFAKIPVGISEELAAASFIQGLTAITLVEETYTVQSGDWILVHAASGGMGGWLVQILVAMGANVIGTASTQAKLDTAKANGCQHLINYTTEDVVQKVKEIVPEGVHCAYDGVGKDTFQISLDCLRRKGTLASFGNASGAVPAISILTLAPKCIKLVRPQVFGYLGTPEERKYYTGKLFDYLSKGELNVKIHKTYPLEDVQQAHADLEGRVSTGKLLLKL